MSDCSFLWSPGTYGTGADPEAGARASLRHQSVRGGVWWHGDINLLFLHTPRCRGPCNARRGAAQCCTAQHSASGRTALSHFVSQSGTFNYLAKSIVRRVAVGMRRACPTAPFFGLQEPTGLEPTSSQGLVRHCGSGVWGPECKVRRRHQSVRGGVWWRGDGAGVSRPFVWRCCHVWVFPLHLLPKQHGAQVHSAQCTVHLQVPLECPGGRQVVMSGSVTPGANLISTATGPHFLVRCTAQPPGTPAVRLRLPCCIFFIFHLVHRISSSGGGSSGSFAAQCSSGAAACRPFPALH